VLAEVFRRIGEHLIHEVDRELLCRIHIR
jgi:hypothetical protein